MLAGWRLVALDRAVGGALGVFSQATAILGDSSVDDLEREKAIQKASLALFGSFASILIRGLVVLVAFLIPIWLADLAGVAGQEEIYRTLMRWDVIIVVSVASIIGYVLWMRIWSPR